MADVLLNAIIQLENRIQQQLQMERTRADQWLAGVRNEQQQRLSLARQGYAEAEQRALDQARAQGERQADELLAREMEYCTRLEEISDEVLLEVIDRQLADILPEQVDDHQNGKS